MHRALAARLPRDIGIFGASFLQRQADKLAAALNPGPIIELIFHLVRASSDANPRGPQRHPM